MLRRRAWELADRLGWARTYNAEYIALTQLQADAFVTLDAELARGLEGVVTTATVEALRSGVRPVGSDPRDAVGSDPWGLTPRDYASRP